MKPADFPPPFDPAEAIAAPSAPPEERIDVGFLVVGGGPAGLACAIRLGQLLEEHPERAEGLGDVPIAVLEKGKARRRHLLSGAVVNPGPLERLLPGRSSRSRARSRRSRVYFLTRGRARAHPDAADDAQPRQPRRLARAAREGSLAREAEDGGRDDPPRDRRAQLLVDGDTVVGVRTGDKGRGRDGQPLADLRAGLGARARRSRSSPRARRATSPARRSTASACAGRAAGLGARREGGVEGAAPARPRDPHDGLAAAAAGAVQGIRRLVRLSARARTTSRSAWSSGSTTATSSSRSHDLLQELKTHPLFRGILEGGERVAWGAKTIPEGGWYALPKRLHAPGLLLCGDGVGLVNVPALKGIHYAVESGLLAAEAAFAGDLPATTRRSATVGSATTCAACGRCARPSAAASSSAARSPRWRRRPAGASRAARSAASRTPRRSSSAATARARTPRRTARSPSTSSPRCTPRATARATTSRATSGSPTRCPRELAELWGRMCPAQVYDARPGDRTATSRSSVSPSNCVQCGAITAKGGRLTPPEGGSGPEYTSHVMVRCALVPAPAAARGARARAGRAQLAVHGRAAARTRRAGKARDPLRRGDDPARAGRRAALEATGAKVGVHLGSEEPAVQAELVRVLRPGGVVYDVGANVGFLTLIAARLVGPDGTCLRLRADPRQSRAASSATPRSTAWRSQVHELALADREGGCPSRPDGELGRAPRRRRGAARRGGRPDVRHSAVPRALAACRPPDAREARRRGRRGASRSKGCAAASRRTAPRSSVELHGTRERVRAAPARARLRRSRAASTTRRATTGTSTRSPSRWRPGATPPSAAPGQAPDATQ